MGFIMGSRIPDFAAGIAAGQAYDGHAGGYAALKSDFASTLTAVRDDHGQLFCLHFLYCRQPLGCGKVTGMWRNICLQVFTIYHLHFVIYFISLLLVNKLIGY